MFASHTESARSPNVSSGPSAYLRPGLGGCADLCAIVSPICGAARSWGWFVVILSPSAPSQRFSPDGWVSRGNQNSEIYQHAPSEARASRRMIRRWRGGGFCRNVSGANVKRSTFNFQLSTFNVLCRRSSPGFEVPPSPLPELPVRFRRCGAFTAARSPLRCCTDP
jgi:hypothetical protein